MARHETNPKRRIAVFFPNARGISCPSLMESVSLLSEDGYMVDLITHRNQTFPVPYFEQAVVRVYGISLISYRAPGLPMMRFLWTAFRVTWRHAYTCFIGYDPFGLLIATLLGKPRKIPIIYHSIELSLLNSRAGFLQRVKKTLERWCHQRALFTIVQDERRSQLLCVENQVVNVEVLLVPNAPGGPLLSSSTKSDYLRRRFNIPKERVILLIVGGIAGFARTFELARAIRESLEECTLVIHGRRERDYFDKVAELADGKYVILSQDFVPSREFDDLVASADIGIAVYDSTYGPNIYEIAHASGRLAAYLRCGLPVIASDFDNLREIVTEYQCGVCVADEHELPEAVRHILSNYASLSANARKCYRQEYDFDGHYRKVVDRIGMLLQQKLGD